MQSIFFSYATEERASLRAFALDFERLGMRALIDHEQISTGASIPESINRMIAESDGAVLFYSTAYARKPWTREEQNAIVYRSMESKDYQVGVVRLDSAELPPLLAHRLWVGSAHGSSLAKAFAPDIRTALGLSETRREVEDWITILREEELEALATAIHLELEQHPSASSLCWKTKRLGRLSIELIQPGLQRLRDNLAFVLRILQSVDFLRNRLRERIVKGGLGIFEGPFLLEEQDRLKQIEEFRRELRSTLDAIVECVVLS